MDSLQLALIQDPITLLEVCALLATLVYLGRLVFTASADRESDALAPSRQGLSQSRFYSHAEVRGTIIGVGKLISEPKRSLSRQVR